MGMNNKTIYPNSGNLPKDVELLTTDVENNIINSENLSANNNKDSSNEIQNNEMQKSLEPNMVDTKSDENLINNVLNNESSCNLDNNSECNNASVTSQRMSALAIENDKNQLKFNANDY